jgi:ABC-type transport system involved in multi-copper enzyme maturation permease subunit
MNPFYWLEIRIRAREKRLWIIALFFLLSVFLIGGGILALSLVESPQRIVPGQLGMAIMYTLLFWHGTILIIMAPLASAGRLAQEREQRTLPALINSHVPPRRIVYGKLFGAWTFVLWLSALVLPFLCIGAIWGGIPIWKLLLPLLFNILISAVLSSVALGFSGVMGRSLTAYLVTGAFLLLWLIVFPILGTIAMALMHAWDGDATWLEYVFFYHNPYYPSIAVVSGTWEMEGWKAVAKLIYGLVCWAILGTGSVWLARRGLQREIY